MKKYYVLPFLLVVSLCAKEKAIARSKTQKKQEQSLVLAEMRRLQKKMHNEKDAQKKREIKNRYDTLASRLS